MAKKAATPKKEQEAQPSLHELQEKLQQLKQEDRRVQEEIAHLQAEMSRTQGRGRRRAEISRSSSIPALQMQQRRLRAEIFRLDQDIRVGREETEEKE
jgi:chromosome segregation ATPase